jgi:hypothetical protein
MTSETIYRKDVALSKENAGIEKEHPKLEEEIANLKKEKSGLSAWRRTSGIALAESPS